MLLNATADSSTDANTGSRTASRKDEHLRINVDEDVSAKGIETGFDDWRFVHRALPDTSTGGGSRDAIFAIVTLTCWIRRGC